jgi:hypothetical protein
MDADHILASGGLSAAILAVGAIAYKLLKHCRFYSDCCGHESEARLDLSPSSSENGWQSMD